MKARLFGVMMGVIGLVGTTAAAATRAVASGRAPLRRSSARHDAAHRREYGQVVERFVDMRVEPADWVRR
ncbi:MAG: hypothetical protein H0X67_15010 [Acidobacteria bacterium]|nr:hypothetical protein [Acidobacteriota bacterium]